MQEQYALALNTLNKWFATQDSPSAQAYVLRAQVQYQLQNYKGALPDIKKAIKMVKAKNKVPKENWLMVERAIYFNSKDFVSMERTLKELITYYPKAQYWLQLSAVYNELGEPEKELSVLETAYDQSLLKNEAQVISLAQAMLSLDVPYKSAQILINGLKSKVVKENGKNLSLLGDALMIAKEYTQAIKVMGQAADLTQLGKDFYKLAQIYTERQEWENALKQVSKALEDEAFNAIEDALVLKGLILYNLNKLDDAKAAFTQAAEFKGTQKAAKQWLTYINGEAKRLSLIHI